MDIHVKIEVETNITEEGQQDTDHRKDIAEEKTLGKSIIMNNVS